MKSTRSFSSAGSNVETLIPADYVGTASVRKVNDKAQKSANDLM